MPKKLRDVEPHSPLWCLTYGDMITQLTAFLLVLFTLASARGDQQKLVLQGVANAFNRYPWTSGGLARVRTATSVAQFQGASANAVHGPDVRVMSVARGRLIAIGGKVLFEKGSAQLRPAGHEILTEIADVVGGLRNPLEITGHASQGEVGPGAHFEDEWELSWRRARAVADFLVKTGNLPEDRLRLTGSSYYKPADLSMFSDEDSRNRRVEILVVSTLDRS